MSERSYIFYTAEGATVAPDNEIPIENCQMLGISKGINHINARGNLLRDNQWILDVGFNPDEIMARRLFNDDVYSF